MMPVHVLLTITGSERKRRRVDRWRENSRCNSPDIFFPLGLQRERLGSTTKARQIVTFNPIIPFPCPIQREVLVR